MKNVKMYTCLQIHARTLERPHACKPARPHARILRTLHALIKIHAKILSCSRPHTRTMPSYKARLLYKVC